MNAVAELDAALARIHRDIDRRCHRFLHHAARSAGQKRRRERERAIDGAKQRCLDEWANVNDPPCHPGDADWRPCANCSAPNQPLW